VIEPQLTPGTTDSLAQVGQQDFKLKAQRLGA
jgi:hypothetical protein